MNLIYFLVFLLISCVHTLSFAAEVQLKSGNELTAEVGEELGYIDNFLMTADDKRSSRYAKLNTRFLIQAQFDRSLFHFTSKLSNAKFKSFSQDNHTDFSLISGYQFKYNKKQTLTVDADFNRIYEYRGSGITLGKAEQLQRGDSKNYSQAQLGYIYGQQYSVAKLSLALGIKEKEYQTRRVETDKLDTQSRFIYSEFDYLMTGKTYLSTRVEYEQERFANQISNNRNLLKGLFGAKWAPSEITSLDFLFGYQKISFLSNHLNNNNASTWRANIDWRPITSTQVLFHSSRNYQTSYQVEDSYRVVDNYDLALKMDIGRQVSIKMSAGFNNEVLVRFDDRQKEGYVKFDTHLRYQWRDWLACFIHYNVNQVNSDIKSINFNKNSVSIGVNVNI